MASLSAHDDNNTAANWDVRSFSTNAHTSYKSTVTHISGQSKDVFKEIEVECYQAFEVKEIWGWWRENWSNFVHIPYFPAFHRPGWLLRYIVGPHNPDLVEAFMADIWAGITVALTLIPQGLSYATLANLPAICGLYTATLPGALYTFFGSSNQLCVGPVALVSLLMGSLVTQYGIDPTDTNTAIDFAGECALAVGVILCAMSLLNMGNLIRFISHPVMSGFTTAAAMLIGLNQLKSAFNFVKIVVPQQGQEGFDYNWQVMKWFIDNWNAPDPNTLPTAAKPTLIPTTARDHYGTAICFGLYVPLMIILLLNNNIKATPARNKSWAFKAWKMFAALSPFMAIIIGAHVAYELKKSDGFASTKFKTHQYYIKNLKVVGLVTPGLNIIRSSSMKWDFGQLLADVIPCALIAFMESWSVAQRIATQKNELHTLNASQEIWSIGTANLIASICSGYPVAGSFSRSSLNAAAGARTPLSKATCMAVILIALKSLTSTFQYIPNAALSAVIFTAIFNLISFSDYWHAWKHSKKDFFTMIVTTTIVFVFDTSIGLAVGIGCSLFIFLLDVAFNKATAPEAIEIQETNNGVDVVKIHGDLTFLTSGRFKDFYTSRFAFEAGAPDANATINDKIFYAISSTFDYVLNIQRVALVKVLPKAVLVDLTSVRVIDITGMEDLADCARAARSLGIKFVAYNISVEEITVSLIKYGIVNDDSTNELDLSKYLALSTLPTSTQLTVKPEVVEAVEEKDVKKEGDFEMVNVKPALNEV